MPLFLFFMQSNKLRKGGDRMKLIALLMVIIIAITPLVTVVDINEDEVFVEINGQLFSFYGEGFEVGEQIRVIFVNGEIREVLP